MSSGFEKPRDVVVGIGGLFLLFGRELPVGTSQPGDWVAPGAIATAFGLLVVMVPVALFAFVLVPRYHFRLTALPTHRAGPRTFTLSWFEGRSGPEIVAEARTVDWFTELGFEIEKLRELRNRKRRRFMVALTVSAATLMAVLVRLALI